MHPELIRSLKIIPVVLLAPFFFIFGSTGIFCDAILQAIRSPFRRTTSPLRFLWRWPLAFWDWIGGYHLAAAWRFLTGRSDLR